jgi:2,5-diketo-D-gluconate reductase B
MERITKPDVRDRDVPVYTSAHAAEEAVKILTIQGEDVPALGFGTWQLLGEDCVEGVRDALELGYRHIDTAQAYDNEEQVGQGMRESGVDRDEIFLVTKVHQDNFHHDRVIETARESLRKLDTDYVDLLLMHWPNPDVPLSETLGAFRELQTEGSIRHVGVSNFSPALVEEASGHATIFANQVEYHPFQDQSALVEQAKTMDYMLTAYSPLDRGDVQGNDVLREIADRHGKSEAQVALRWLVQQRVSAIPKASSAEHRRANFDIFDFALREDEMQTIFALRN